MNKILITMFFLTIGTNIYAYYGQESSQSKYLKGEISSDEYYDSLGLPRTSQTQETMIYHKDGTKSLMKSDQYEDVVYHRDGSKTRYVKY